MTETQTQVSSSSVPAPHEQDFRQGSEGAQAAPQSAESGCVRWHDWEEIDSTPTSHLMRCKRCGYEERHFDD